jgi:hypothetical protein
MHLAVWSVTSSLMVRLIFNVIALAVLVPVTVNTFRTLLSANEEEVSGTPSRGDTARASAKIPCTRWHAAARLLAMAERVMFRA